MNQHLKDLVQGANQISIIQTESTPTAHRTMFPHICITSKTQQNPQKQSTVQSLSQIPL